MEKAFTSEFPLGFWCFEPAGKWGSEEVLRWKKCGITLTQSPAFWYERGDDIQQFLEFMDACAEQGIRLILRVGGLDYPYFLKDPDGYRKKLDRAYEDFGKHPATYGFFIGDEPSGQEQNQACISAYRLQREKAPELTPFLNFNPFYSEASEKHVFGPKGLHGWLEEFAEESGCRMVCYDCYWQMEPGADGEKGTEIYFRNFKIYSEAAAATGMEFWFTPLSCGHFRYRTTSEDDLRWQMNTAIASGCRGIIWYTFYTPFPGNNYRLGPIDEFGEKTETYYALARVQKRFHCMYGQLLYHLKHKKTWHFEKCYGTWELFPEDTHPFIKRMESVHKLPGILSLFEDENGKEYVVLVNNTPFESGRFAFVLDKQVQKIWRMGMNGDMKEDFAVRHGDAIYYVRDNDVYAGVWLAPGQMEIFCFE